MVFFDTVALAPADPILGLMGAFHADMRPNKVNLSVGVYKTKELKTPVMECVKLAEKALIEKEATKEYLPIDGKKRFLDEAGQLIFTDGIWQEIKERTSSFQSIGGTGALRIGGDFICHHLSRNIVISDPSWPNHRGVFTACGFTVGTYPYYDSKTNEFTFDRLYQTLSNLPEKSVVVFHASCHNPSGMDPSHKQWEELADLCISKRLFPFFDAAYLGFDESVKKDSFVLQLFARRKIEFALAVSFSKSFSLYAERIGALYFVTDSKKTAEAITSQIKVIIRRNYSNPPLHGSSIIEYILCDAALRKKWEIELGEMRERIFEMRKAFAKALSATSKVRQYEYLLETKGLFSFCCLEKSEVEKLKDQYGIYMTSDGRINVAGLNWDNLDYVVDAIVAITG